MRRLFVGFLATVGFLFIFGLVGVMIIIMRTINPDTTVSLPDRFVLMVDMEEQSSTEHIPHQGLLAALTTSKQLTFYDLTQTMNAAVKDKRITSILFKIDGCNLSVAQIQELRDLISDFRDTGRDVIAYAHSYGDNSNGTKAYYLASAASEVVMQPMGEVSITGFMAEVPFAKTALTDWGIQARLAKRAEYKSMPETVLETDFTPAHRENLTAIMNGLLDQVSADIAEDMELPQATIKQYIDGAPYLAEEAVQLNLINRLEYLTNLKNEMGGGEKVISATTYFHKHHSPDTSHENKIALIFAEGMILPNGSEDENLLGDYTIEGDSTAHTIDQAAKDPHVKAIVIRLSSGGGSPTASETIAEAVQRAKASGKPVIMSMSSVAASGGYWIATQGSKIVAQPGTITGSIGVYGGKIITQTAWANHGVNWGEVHRGSNAGMWSSSMDYSDMGWQKVNDMMDNIYQGFIQRVSNSRGLDIGRVTELAKGRVWLGVEAKGNGLVDQLGGLNDAIALAKAEAKLDGREVSIDEFPKRKSIFDTLINLSPSAEAKTLIRMSGLPISTFFGTAKRYPLQMTEFSIK